MLDTLKLARELREGDVFTGDQAERLAGAIARAGAEAGASDNRRLNDVESGLRDIGVRFRDVEVRLGVLTWTGGILVALVLAVLWQLYALRGEVSGSAARTDARLGSVEQQLGANDRRLGAIEQRLGGVEQRLGAVEERLGAAPLPPPSARP